MLELSVAGLLENVQALLIQKQLAEELEAVHAGCPLSQDIMSAGYNTRWTRGYPAGLGSRLDDLVLRPGALGLLRK